MCRCWTIVILLQAFVLEVFVVAIPPQWGTVSPTPAGMTARLGLGPNIVSVTTTAPGRLTTHPGLLKREVGNDFCGWGFGEAGQYGLVAQLYKIFSFVQSSNVLSAWYVKCDGTPGLCLYDPTQSVVGCDVGLGPIPTKCVTYDALCNDSCRFGQYQKGTLPW